MVAKRWYSNAELNRAGRLLADHTTGRIPQPAQAELNRAQSILQHFRKQHLSVIAQAETDLLAIVASMGLSHELQTRLKTFARILDKLDRFPWVSVSNMRDIAGCRVTLPNQAAVAAVTNRLLTLNATRTGNPGKLDDLVTDPRPTGYRAIHLSTKYDQLWIEVQIRTHRQSRWARYTEFLTDETGIDYKGGNGDPAVHGLIRQLSDLYALDDAGEVSAELLNTHSSQLIREISLGTGTSPDAAHELLNRPLGLKMLENKRNAQEGD